MEPVKRDGKIREQIEIEYAVTSDYPKKWGRVTKDQRIQFYSHEKINDVLSKCPSNDICPFKYTNSGDSFFLSEDMYKALVAKCRCGRPKAGIHLGRCLQKCKNEYLSDKDEQSHDSSKKPIPNTSAGMYGWSRNRFTQWELSTKYVSPQYDMPGGRINDHPFSHVFIG